MKQRQAFDYQTIVQHALNMMRNPNINVFLLHIPVPHPPGFWNPATHSFVTDITANYLDNLDLADRTLGLFRHALEESGEWDQAITLVSADHPLRPALWRGLGIWDHELSSLTKNRASR